MKHIKAEFITKNGADERVKSKLLGLFDLSNSEKGTIRYTLYQNAEKPEHFCFVEHFADEQALNCHMNAPQLAATLADLITDLQAAPTVQSLDLVKSVGVEDKSPLISFLQVDRNGVGRWVRSDMKDEQNRFCICHKCRRFNPQEVDKGCSIIASVLKLANEQQVILPVWECASFLPAD